MKIAAGNTLLYDAADPSKVGTIQAGAISQRIKKMYCDAADIKGVSAEIAQHEINEIVKQFSRPQAKVSVSQPPKPAEQPPPIEIIPEPINDIDKPPANIEQFDWDRVLEEAAQLPQPKTSDTDEPIVPGTPYGKLFEEVAQPYAQVKSAQQSRYSANHSRASLSMPQQKFNWRKAATFLMACFCVTLFVNLWFYVSWEIQLNRAAKTDAHIKQLVTDTANANKRSRAILGDIDGSKTEIGRVKAELDNSAAELKKVQDEIAAANAGIADIRQGNSDAVKRLTEQIRRLTGQLAELKNSAETGTDAISAR
jgi:methyl-accepting chemotaxis protein